MSDILEEIRDADEALGHGGDELQQEPGQGEGGSAAPSEPPGLSNTETIAASLQAAVAMLSPMFPSLGPVYTPQTIEAVAVSVGRVADRRGWVVAKIFGKYADEIAAAAVVVPVAIATYQAVLHDLEKKAANDEDGGKKEEGGKKGEGATVHKLEPVRPQNDGDR